MHSTVWSQLLFAPADISNAGTNRKHSCRIDLKFRQMSWILDMVKTLTIDINRPDWLSEYVSSTFLGYNYFLEYKYLEHVLGSGAAAAPWTGPFASAISPVAPHIWDQTAIQPSHARCTH